MKVNCIVFIVLTYLISISHSALSQDIPKQYTIQYDHLVFFVTDTLLEESLSELFTPAEKLTSTHKEQGTSGKYYLFYNTFIELLYLEDSLKAAENEKRFGSNYTQRWNKAVNPFPLGFGLGISPFDSIASKNDFKVYTSLDQHEEDFYLMSKNNHLLDQPMIYASSPDRLYEGFNSLKEIDHKVEKYKREDLKSYLTHPSKVKRLTKIIIGVTDSMTFKSNLNLICSLEEVSCEVSGKRKTELIFDNKLQGKEVRIKSNPELVIYY